MRVNSIPWAIMFLYFICYVASPIIFYTVADTYIDRLNPKGHVPIIKREMRAANLMNAFKNKNLRSWLRRLTFSI